MKPLDSANWAYTIKQDISVAHGMMLYGLKKILVIVPLNLSLSLIHILFQDRRPLIRLSLQKGGKTALGQKHGTGKAAEIHTGHCLYGKSHLPEL